MMLATDLAVLDHDEGTVAAHRQRRELRRHRRAGRRGVRRRGRPAGRMTADLAAAGAGRAPSTSTPTPSRAYTSNRTRDGLPGTRSSGPRRRSARARRSRSSWPALRDADARRAALDIYRVLRRSNPSPYMYLLRFDGFDVVGSSPEALVKVNDGRALLHPIAGTRWRGATPEEDDALGRGAARRREGAGRAPDARRPRAQRPRPGLRAGQRRGRRLHVGRALQPRHAHRVDGRRRGWREGRTAYDVLAACFPAGTLSGAPKPRAMELIEELEPTRRGLYGGAVGYLDFAGDLDTAIAIRTALLRDGVAYVQAGAGIVADSDPAAEDTESRNKAAAVLRAVAVAGTLRPSTPRDGRVTRLRSRRAALVARRRRRRAHPADDVPARGARSAAAQASTAGAVLTGREAAPAAFALSLAALAGLAVLLLVGGAGRRVVGVAARRPRRGDDASRGRAPRRDLRARTLAGVTGPTTVAARHGHVGRLVEPVVGLGGRGRWRAGRGRGVLARCSAARGWPEPVQPVRLRGRATDRPTRGGPWTRATTRRSTPDRMPRRRRRHSITSHRRGAPMSTEPHEDHGHSPAAWTAGGHRDGRLPRRVHRRRRRLGGRFLHRPRDRRARAASWARSCR